MKVSYSLSHSQVAVNQASVVDLIVSFAAESETHNQNRRPLNLSLVIDRSGSMAGNSLKKAKQAAQRLVEFLTPDDFLSIVIFDDTPEVIFAHQSVGDKALVKAAIDKIRAGGCTNLSGGWLMGCERVKSQANNERINRVLLLTDGLANMGITDNSVLINTAKEKAQQGIITTTLGFGNGFNEDLLIGMANASGGNFYFIQSPDDASDVFRIELESLTSVVAQNLSLTLQPNQVQLTELNNYRCQQVGDNLEVFLGDVYAVEPKKLALELAIPAIGNLGKQKLLNIAYKYETVVDGSIQEFSNELPIQIAVVATEEASKIQPDAAAIAQTNQLRIARIKDEAIALADKGEYTAASEAIRGAIAYLKSKILQETFEVAEELDQLDHYAQNLESRNYNSTIRKEMRDQSYQAQRREREDLKLRGVAGSASSLKAVSAPGNGILVKCFRENGKLRIRAISEGYDSNFNVQFPRNIRQEGVTYVVESIKLSADGSFYRAGGNICRLVQPGQEYADTNTSKTPKRQKLNAPTSAADLETTDSVGDGVLVQCVKEGSKLRARVVSDGYNPNYNIRFPRDIREENVLYVVDEVEEAKNGGSYVAYGKIKRLVQ